MLAAVVAVAVMILAMGPAAAESVLDLLDAKVPYQAQFYVDDGKQVYRGTVWHAPGRQRRDFDTQGGGQAVLLRRDTDRAYLMKPSGRWYVGLNLPAAAALAGGLDAMSVERTRLKAETVAGIRATKFRIAAVAAQGGRFDGDAWFSTDGILVKAKGILSQPNGGTAAVETGLERLKIGAVDERLFELPAGWLGLDLGSVPADRIGQVIDSMRPMLEGRR